MPSSGSFGLVGVRALAGAALLGCLHAEGASAQDSARDAGPASDAHVTTVEPLLDAGASASSQPEAGKVVAPTATPKPELLPSSGESVDAALPPGVDGALPPGEEQGQLGTIIVTAQRRSDSVQKTPLAISAFGQDQIQQQNISTLRDLAGRVPGLLAPQRSTAYTTQTYSMRGVGETDTYPEPAVAVYIDDVYLARSVGSVYDTPDLERVEVLRGPQGTLYGRNSSAGAIRFITKTPTSERTAYLQARLGTLNDVDLRARVAGGILADDKLNASVSLIKHTRRGYTYSVPLHRYVNDIDIWALRSKVKSIVTNSFSITLSGDIMWDRSSQSYYTPINQPNGIDTGRKTDPDKTWSNTQPYNRTTVYGGSLTLQYDINNELSLKSVTAVRGMHGPIYYDNDGVTWIKGDSYAGFDQHNETQELLLNGEYKRVNFVGGLYYFNEYFHNHRLSQAAGSPTNNVGTISHTNNRLYTQSLAGFGQANVKIWAGLSGTAGIRYTIDFRRFENVGQQQGGLPLVYPLPDGFNPDEFNTLFTDPSTRFSVHAPRKSFDAFTPKLGLQYAFNDDLLAFVSFSQGFKSGGYDLRANNRNASLTTYKPQITSSYEAGWKSAFLANRLTFNLNVYYNQIKDFQVRATSPGALGMPVNSLINAGNGHSYGGEAEAAAEPVKGLRLGASLAYLRTGYDTFTAMLPNNVAGRTTLLGRRFPLAPTWQANFNFNYRLPLRIPGAVRIGGDIPYESLRYIDIYNTKQTRVRAQYFVNATLNYTSESGFWSTGLQVSNLLDLRRPQSGNYAPANAGSEPLYYAGYNPPRQIIAFVTLGKN